MLKKIKITLFIDNVKISINKPFDEILTELTNDSYDITIKSIENCILLYDVTKDKLLQLLKYYYDKNTKGFYYYALWLDLNDGSEFNINNGFFIKDGYENENFNEKLIKKYQKINNLENFIIPNWINDMMIEESVENTIVNALIETDEYIIKTEDGKHYYIIN